MQDQDKALSDRPVDASSPRRLLRQNLPAVALAVILTFLAGIVTSGLAGPRPARLAAAGARNVDRPSSQPRTERAESISEQELLRIWLAAELRSLRFGTRLRESVSELGYDERAICEPSGDDPILHRQRREVIRARGIHWDPERTVWLVGRHWRREMRRVETVMAKALYAPHEGWIEMSGGSRSPLDVARRCREGRLNAAHTTTFEQIAAAYRAGSQVPQIILLEGPDRTLIALEGHARLTGLALASLDGALPFRTIEVIVGYRKPPDRLRPALARFKRLIGIARVA